MYDKDLEKYEKSKGIVTKKAVKKAKKTEEGADDDDAKEASK